LQQLFTESAELDASNTGTKKSNKRLHNNYNMERVQSMGGSELFDHNEMEVGEAGRVITPKSSASISQENSCSSRKKHTKSSPSDKSTSMNSSINSTPFSTGKLESPNTNTGTNDQ
jgi:hypothetical protein